MINTHIIENISYIVPSSTQRLSSCIDDGDGLMEWKPYEKYISVNNILLEVVAGKNYSGSIVCHL